MEMLFNVVKVVERRGRGEWVLLSSSRKFGAGGGNIAPIFSTHASAIAEIKCRLLFVEEVTEAEDFPSRG
jgi:hypothetical protein